MCDAVTFNEALDIIGEFTKATRPSLVLTPNMAHVLQASRFADLADAYRMADLATPDGWPLVLACRILRRKERVERVTGSDLLPALCSRPYSVVLIGGRGDSAERASKRLRARNPRLIVAGTELAPPHVLKNEGTRRDLLSRIGEYKADLIFVGLGVPKQERLALELLEHLPRGVVICVGASVEFEAGTARRSPPYLQRAGLEWLHRLTHDPRKLFVRYFLATPYFLFVLARLMGVHLLVHLTKPRAARRVRRQGKDYSR